MSKQAGQAMPRISDAEWRVMQVLWDEAPLSASEVVDRLGDEPDWSPRTVKTMLGRLVQKGALTYTEEGNKYLYRPAVTRSACLRDASKSFLSRVFSGDTQLLLAHLVEAGRLSSEDIQMLKQTLEDKALAMAAWIDGWYAVLDPGLRAVLTLSWQASVLVLIVLSVQTAFGRWLSPRWRYALWSVVVLRLMLPVTPGSVVSVFNLFHGGAEQSAVSMVLPTVSSEVPPDTITTLGWELSTVAADGSPLAGPDIRWQPRWTPAKSAKTAWLAGAAFVMGVLLLINMLLALRLRRVAVLNDPGVLELVESCKREMGVKRTVRLIVDRKIASPALAGVLRPTLLIPSGLLDDMPREELRFILLHELAHVKKHDIAMNWLLIALSALHWFNPLIWLAFSRLRADRELARDAMVLRATGTDASQAYGQTIIRVLERLARPRLNNPALAGIGDGMGQLKRRLRMIALSPKRRPALTVVGVVLLATLMAIGLTDAAEPIIAPSDDMGAVANPNDTTDLWGHVLAGTAEARAAIDFIEGEGTDRETHDLNIPVDAAAALLREAYQASINETLPQEKAIALYREYLEANPHSPFIAEVYFRIGQLYNALDRDAAPPTYKRQMDYYARAHEVWGDQYSTLNVVAWGTLANRSDSLEEKKAYYDWLRSFQHADKGPEAIYPYRTIASTFNGTPAEWSLADRERIAGGIGERLGPIIETAEKSILGSAITNPDHLRDLARSYPDTSLGREAAQQLKLIIGADPANGAAENIEVVPEIITELAGTWRTPEGAADPVVLVFTEDGRATITDEPNLTANYQYVVEGDRLFFTREGEKLDFAYRFVGERLLLTYGGATTGFVRDSAGLRFDQTPLEEVVDRFRPYLDGPLFFNWEELKAAGVERDELVTVAFDFEKEPVGLALKRLIDTVSDGNGLNTAGVAMVDGVRTVSTMHNLRRLTDPSQTRVYDIRDLMVQVPDFEAEPLGPRADGAVSERPARIEPSREEIVGQITDLIRRTVGSYEEWKAHGGDLSSIDELNGNLVIATSRENHENIKGLLALLRKGRAQISVEACFLLVTEEFAKESGIDMRFSGLPEDQRVRFLDDLETDLIVKSTRDSSSGTTLVMPRMVLSNGQNAYITIQQQSAYVSGFKHVEGEDGVSYEPVINTINEGALLQVQAMIRAGGSQVFMALHPTILNVKHPIEKQRWEDASPDQTLFIEVPGFTQAEVETTITMLDKSTVMIDIGTVTGPMKGVGDVVDPVEEGVERRVYMLVKPTIIREAAEETGFED